MQNFKDTFETCKQSFINAFSISMTLPLNTFVQKGNPNDLGKIWIPNDLDKIL